MEEGSIKDISPSQEKEEIGGSVRIQPRGCRRVPG
jgi:hypothetical protein